MIPKCLPALIIYDSYFQGPYESNVNSWQHQRAVRFCLKYGKLSKWIVDQQSWRSSNIWTLKVKKIEWLHDVVSIPMETSVFLLGLAEFSLWRSLELWSSSFSRLLCREPFIIYMTPAYDFFLFFPSEIIHKAYLSKLSKTLESRVSAVSSQYKAFGCLLLPKEFYKDSLVQGAGLAVMFFRFLLPLLSNNVVQCQ